MWFATAVREPKGIFLNYYMHMISSEHSLVFRTVYQVDLKTGVHVAGVAS